MNVKLNFKASPQLEKNLKTINEKIMKEAKKIIIETALVDIESEAKNKLTNGGHVVTGRLRASIHTKYKSFNNSYSYRNMLGESFNESLKVNPIDTKTFFDVYVGTNVIYAQKIERLDAYLYPSFLSAKNDLKRRLKNLIKKI